MESSIEKLGNILAGFVRESQAARQRMLLELGSINADGSLSVDSLAQSIPKGEYMLGLHLTSLVDSALQTYSATHTHSGGAHAQMSGSGAHSHDGGAHTHGIPQTMRGTKAGDRVLIAWVGVEPIVVAIVVSS